TAVACGLAPLPRRRPRAAVGAGRLASDSPAPARVSALLSRHRRPCAAARPCYDRRGRIARMRKRNAGGLGTRLARISERGTVWTGSSWGFGLALGIVLVWLVSGPFFRFSDTWQLVINTGTTIVTFLMVFLIQRTQNKDALALH